MRRSGWKWTAAAGGLAALLAGVVVMAAEELPRLMLEERFATLKNWESRTFPKITEHTIYSAERGEDGTWLKARSNRSASGLVLRDTWNLRDYPLLRWKWKVDKVFTADPREKSGDDFPLRIMVLFAYDPERATAWEKITYNTAKLLHGVYPPHSGLSYVWAGRMDLPAVIVSPYTDRERSMPLERGTEKVGAWVREEVDILRDYRAAFGGDPPPTASLGIMSDSDNTGGAATGYITDLEVARP